MFSVRTDRNTKIFLRINTPKRMNIDSHILLISVILLIRIFTVFLENKRFF